MVRSLNLLRNIGRFDNVNAGAHLAFERLTLIYAENARGKSTLAAILRSLASGRADLVTERARLGAAHPPHIVVDVGGPPPAMFQDGGWTRTVPEIVVFDDTFVAENVCSGIEVGTTHRQNLHELIVGAPGVALARALQTEVDLIEKHNREMRERENAIPVQIRGTLTVEQFCAIAPVPELERAVEDAERRLAAARNSDRIAATQVFEPLMLPRIDMAGLRELLAKGLPELDVVALRRAQDHMERLGRSGEAWVRQGLQYAAHLAEAGDSDCPFCSQDLAASPVIAHYRGFFSEGYHTLRQEIIAAVHTFRAAHSGEVPAAFERGVRETVERQTFWGAFVDMPVVALDTAAIGRSWRAAREVVEQLLESKAANPLEAIPVTAEGERALVEHNARCDQVSGVSEQFVGINAQLEIVKEQARDANVAVLSSDLANVYAVRSRYEPANVTLCDAYVRAKNTKAETEARRTAARQALDEYRQAAFPAYGVAINDFLQRFNATFRLGPIDPVNNRGGSAANYTLLVDGHRVPLVAEAGRNSFRNTLSAGDRNTLALAFFFASLVNDPDRARRIVVIDDPMTSLDEHRTLHTLQEIDRLAQDVTSVVVLSHSKPFLFGVWDKCQQLRKTALEVRRAGQSSTLLAWDVHAAMVTLHDSRFAAAADYVDNPDPSMERRVAESLRPMLEHYCRVAYPRDFPPGTMLGQFHSLCAQRLGAAREILNPANTQELRAILDYANRFHHDSNLAFATELINEAELTDLTQRTIRFIQR
ncbi:AAA family ATPase [Phyllobacterium sp. SYP-B3895]|uniref:AAA family ATPase n=1 Tax=Phyllobacterium sp. SYP-B3895 TaxID=2663240 RepID=UPI001299A171|nr:AAA family ATPase [Phyllobacterium sp. SYP-B3895]MRG56765.1 AAA family ATPase [Phyllobacterium sp. SYP-B3895]